MRLPMAWTALLLAFGAFCAGPAHAKSESLPRPPKKPVLEQPVEEAVIKPVEKPQRAALQNKEPEEEKPQVQPSTGAGTNAARAWLTYYKDAPDNVNYRTVMEFIERHPDFPAMNRIREVAEKAMPSSLSDEQYLAWFSKNPPQTTFGMQMYAGALIRSGQEQKAHDEINKWWRNAALTPNDQSKAFMVFATYLDKSAHEERLRRLISKSQYTNARSIAQALGAGYHALTEARISLRNGRPDVNYWINRIPSTLIDDEGFLYDRLVWRRKNDQDAGAIEILNKSVSFDHMTDPEGWGKERAIMVRRLLEEKKYDLAYRLSARHGIQEGTGFSTNEWAAGWIALEYLNRPWDAFEHFERLYHNVETPISKSRAAYWAGLASERLGHPEVAKKWYAVGAKLSTTFYGQLSSERLGQPLNIPVVSVPESGAMKNSALANAARWLRKNGNKAEAGMFLTRMIDLAKTPQDFAAAASLASELSMKNYGIKAAQECEKKTGTPIVAYAFPRIEKYMRDVPVEWALVHALIRQESRYEIDAMSPVGARGLMQLMPRTAKEVAAKARMKHDVKWLTTQPGHNVALGSRYLQQLLNKYDGNYAMALAAYNAGPSRVYKWVEEFGDPRDPRVNLVNWIEMIPIYETRNYVQRVLEGVYVYRQILSRNKGKQDGGVTHLALQ
jgi:soluble lytic murein transglycosylase